MQMAESVPLLSALRTYFASAISISEHNHNNSPKAQEILSVPGSGMEGFTF